MYHADRDKGKCDLRGGRRYTFVEYERQNHARIELNDASIRYRAVWENWRIQFYYMINVVLASRDRNIGGLVVNQLVGSGLQTPVKGAASHDDRIRSTRGIFFQRFSNNLTSASAAMPNRPRARMVARTETLAALWTIGLPQQGHIIDVVTGVRLLAWRMC